MSSFAPIDQKLEIERLLRILRLVSQRTSKNATFNVIQLRTLLRIYRNEPVQVSDFKKTYVMGTSRLSRILMALRILGLINSIRDPLDSRRRIVSMTDEGRALVEEILQITI